MKALVLNCTLKPSPHRSNTEALANEFVAELRQLGIDTTMLRVADHYILSGSWSDMGEGDTWPDI